jgi:hypothetical protein
MSMKKSKIVLALAVSFFMASAAFAATKKAAGPFAACNSTKLVTSGGMIYKNSAPIRSGGVGTPLIGYRVEPTLILVGRGIGNKSTTTIYASNGKKIGSCPWASAHDTLGGRYRCTMNTRSLRRSAVAAARSPTIYFKLKAGVCAEVPDAGKCYGSVKGLCNQIMR